MEPRWVRGRRSNDIFLTPEQFHEASNAFRALQRNVPFVAQLIGEGLSKKQICTRLKWSLQSLNYVLADHRLNLDRRDVYRRLYRKTS
jgi:hypothetical protein